MPTIQVNVPAEKLHDLQNLAAELNSTVEDLVRVSIDEMLSLPKDDLIEVAEDVLKKNAELYRCLV